MYATITDVIWHWADLFKDLIDHLRRSLPKLPDTMIDELTQECGLSKKDAGTLLSFDDGDRLEYFFNVMARLRGSVLPDYSQAQLGKVAGNWCVTLPNVYGAILTSQGPHGTRLPLQEY